MELHIQKCQKCGSRNLRNILVRDTSQLVYVQCRECESLVARYKLAKGGYYHAGKGFESFLRSLERDGGFVSGRTMQTDFESTEQEVADDFEALKATSHKKYGDKLP